MSAPPRAAGKRRSKPSFGARLRRFWVLGLLVLGAVGWGCGALAALPAFHLHELTVTGTARVARADVVAQAAIDPHANIWLLDPRAIERRIDAIPDVLHARVHRRPPGTVWIEIAERRPEACVHDGAGHELLVDAQLRVLSELCTPEVSLGYDVRANLDGAGPGTFLREPEVLALQADARALSVGGDTYRDFSHDEFGQLDATMPGGIQIRFGDDDDLDRKRRLIAPILAQLGPRLADVRAVDLRAPGTPVVDFR